ncbi:MAG: hypothetical protein A2V67_08870 [Deltaproteobacteria bacterium RBG_13_61_14]|nr:MAG: hypothetical protein A2V67_08870 [Deltaproteobacteria bacterium RBG_13_61_14]
MKLMVMLGTRMVNESFEEEVAEGTTLEKLFQQVDGSKRFKKKYFKEILAAPRPPVVLLNGNRVEVPEELGEKLNEGDEVSVVSPIAGG